MLTQLSTVKARLGLDDLAVNYDAMLTAMIAAISARFDRYCGRTLERTAGITQEFEGDATELRLRCFPVETIAGFAIKQSEDLGWVEQGEIACLLRSRCVVLLRQPLADCTDALRITYTGGYVAPGTAVGTGQTPLPADLEMAAIEQVAYWHMNRDRLGIVRQWPKGGEYLQFSELDLLPNVQAVLKTHQVIVV